MLGDKLPDHLRMVDSGTELMLPSERDVARLRAYNSLTQRLQNYLDNVTRSHTAMIIGPILNLLDRVTHPRKVALAETMQRELPNYESSMFNLGRYLNTQFIENRVINAGVSFNGAGIGDLGETIIDMVKVLHQELYIPFDILAPDVYKYEMSRIAEVHEESVASAMLRR
jgi:hypothetical protein